MEEPNDASSNPRAEEHLDAVGEFDAANVPQNNPLVTDQEEDTEEEGI